MHYSDNPGSVRGDVFKPSGKWYATVELDMSGCYDDPDLSGAILRAFQRANWGSPASLAEGWSYVVLEPYHRHAHPIMIKGY